MLMVLYQRLRQLPTRIKFEFNSIISLSINLFILYKHSLFILGHLFNLISIDDTDKFKFDLKINLQCSRILDTLM